MVNPTYCSVSDIENALNCSFSASGLSFTDSSGNPYIADGSMTTTRLESMIVDQENYINSISSESYTEVTASEEKQEVYLYEGEIRFSVDNTPVTETTSVYYDSTGNNDWESMSVGTDLSSDDVYLDDEDTGTYVVIGDYSVGDKRIKISYKYGNVSVPTFLKYATIYATCAEVVGALVFTATEGDWRIAMERRREEYIKKANKLIEVNVTNQKMGGGVF